jgi:selenocysteine-specific elongation factor
VDAPRRLVIGTAGHIDHGKSLLVRALTGIDPDRLKEEKERGITIDLGFASLTLPDGTQAGFVDVPGHERFVRNMLAGVGGIDLVLLVIAADESIKPQTREHFQICRLLGIPRGLIVLTKSDLVDPEILEIVRLEVREFVSGSFLERAPILAVSAKTGAGLEELKKALTVAAGSVPARPEGRVFRLPVDRSFSIRGFGTVVTGTLISGRVTVGEEIEVLPGRLRAKVRGLEVFGEARREASAGQRTAVNLQGLEAASVLRGDLLAPRDVLRPSRLLDVKVEALAGESGIDDLMPVRFHHLSFETMGRIRLAGQERLQPGESAFAQIRLSRPVAAVPGDRFILRRPSPAATLGGGVILDNLPKKLRAPEAEALAGRLRSLESPDHPVRLQELIHGAGGQGMDLSELRARTGWSAELLLETLAPLLESGQAMRVPSEPPRFLSVAHHDQLLEAVVAAVEAFHREHPLQVGLPKEEIRSRFFRRSSGELFKALLEEGTRRGKLRVDRDLVASAGHRVTLKGAEVSASERIEASFRDAGLNPPDPAQVVADLALKRETADNLFFLLLKQGKLVRVQEGRIFHAAALEALKAKIWEHRKTSDLLDIATFKDLSGTTRKNAIPLLEYLDTMRVTRRDGDRRRILPPTP